MTKAKTILFLMIFALVSVCAAQTEYGMVTRLDGKLFKEAGGQTREVREGELVFIDDQLRTGEGSYAEIRFRGKNYLIDADTEFSLRQISVPPRSERKVAAKADYIVGILELLETASVLPVKAGDELRVSDVVRTGERSYAELLYGDKILVKVDQNTTLEIKEFEEKRKTLKQLIGKIWVKAKKLVAEKFEVETRFGTAGVRGTQFGVSVDGAEGLDVDCEEGAVYMRSPSGEEVEIPAGMRCGIRPDGSLKDIVKRPESGGFDDFGPSGDGVFSPEVLEAVRELQKLGRAVKAEPGEDNIRLFLAKFAALERIIGPEERESAEYGDLSVINDMLTSLLEKIKTLIYETVELAETLLAEPDADGYELLMSNLTEIERITGEYGILFEDAESLTKKAEMIKARLGQSHSDDREGAIALKTVEDELMKWESLLSVRSSVVDFKMLASNIEKFTQRRPELSALISGYMRGADQSGDEAGKRYWEQAAKRVDGLKDETLRLQEIIKYESYVFNRVSATRDKLYIFKTELEAFSSHTDSASLWIEQAVNAVTTGVDIAVYAYEARTWSRLGNKYEALRSEISDYEKLISDAKRKGIFYTSARILKEYEEMLKLSGGFKVKKGCCLVTMNFGQVRRIFVLLKSFFMTSEGRSLL